MFSNKTVIITGASAGVGAACVHAFAQLGANLVLVARGQDGLDAIAAELPPTTNFITIAMDVANTDDCTELMAKAYAKFGAIHILVNNAGLALGMNKADQVQKNHKK